MMKMECDVIQDLIPLYVEHIASEKSCKLVEEHVNECDKCKAFLEEIQEPEFQIVDDTEPLKKIKRNYRKHTLSLIGWSVFLTIAVIMFIKGVFFLEPGEEMGYCILNFYLLLPLSALICSGILGTQRNLVKWFAPLIFGIIGGILPYVIFHSFDWIFIVFAFIPSLIGLFTGVFIRWVTKLNKRNK